MPAAAQNSRVTGRTERSAPAANAIARKARTIESLFPQSVSEVKRKTFLKAAAKEIQAYQSLQTTGAPLPTEAIRVFTAIARTTKRWEAELAKWYVKLPDLRRLCSAALRKKAIYQRSRGRSADPLRASLILDLHEAYVTARGGDPTVRGFQAVANAVLRAANLPPVSKHDLAGIQAQVRPFTKCLRTGS
jgi:hypothetical protein